MQPPFVGREAELGVLVDRLDALHAGRPGLVVVEGERGSGKTRLLAEALTRRGSGARVLRGAGSEARRRYPIGALGRVLPARELTCPGPLLDRLVRGGPVVAILEDLQWVDRRSLETVACLARGIGDRPILALLTLSPGTRSEAVRALDATRLELPGLDPDAVTELAAAVAPPGSRLHGIADRSGGNPRLAIALAAAGNPAVPPPELTASVLGSLPTRTLDALRAAAVLGREFAVADLARLSGGPVARLLPALDAALRTGLLDERGTRLRFRHGVVRDAVYAGVPRPVRIALHADAGGVVARARAERARALLAGGDPAEAARVAATVRSPDVEACCVSRSVLSLVGSGWGRAGLAVDLAADALRRDPGEGLAHRALVAALLRADRVDEAAQALKSATGRAPLDDLDAILRFRTGRWEEPGPVTGALVAVHRNQLDLADRLLAADHRGPEPHAHWTAWGRALCAEARGQPEMALDQLRAAWTACTRAGMAVDYPLLGPDLVRLLLGAGDRAAARDAVAQVAEIARRVGSRAATGASMRCAALLDDDPAAAQHAVQILRGEPFPLAFAQACEQAGTAGLLQQARDSYRALGAHRDLARVEARLRALGVRCRPGRRQATADRGWASLTAAERSVVDLTASGLTNREVACRLFISPRTVETHLTHVYAKLGVRGRSGLRVAVARRPDTYGGLPDVRQARFPHDRPSQLRATEGPGR